MAFRRTALVDRKLRVLQQRVVRVLELGLVVQVDVEALEVVVERALSALILLLRALGGLLFVVEQERTGLVVLGEVAVVVELLLALKDLDLVLLLGDGLLVLLDLVEGVARVFALGFLLSFSFL